MWARPCPPIASTPAWILRPYSRGATAKATPIVSRMRQRAPATTSAGIAARSRPVLHSAACSLTLGMIPPTRFLQTDPSTSAHPICAAAFGASILPSEIRLRLETQRHRETDHERDGPLDHPRPHPQGVERGECFAVVGSARSAFDRGEARPAVYLEMVGD